MVTPFHSSSLADLGSENITCSWPYTQKLCPPHLIKFQYVFSICNKKKISQETPNSATTKNYDQYYCSKIGWDRGHLIKSVCWLFCWTCFLFCEVWQGRGDGRQQSGRKHDLDFKNPRFCCTDTKHTPVHQTHSSTHQCSAPNRHHRHKCTPQLAPTCFYLHCIACSQFNSASHCCTTSLCCTISAELKCNSICCTQHQTLMSCSVSAASVVFRAPEQRGRPLTCSGRVAPVAAVVLCGNWIFMKLPQKLGTISVAHSRVVGIQYLLQGEGVCQ